MNEAPADDPPASLPRFLLAILLTGLTAGLGGMLLGMLLHAVQHLAYGYSLDRIVGTETFLQGVEAASDVRRLAVLMLCGLVAGGGWWLVYRFGRPLVSVTQAVQDPAARMPARTTLAHALLQIVTVSSFDEAIAEANNTRFGLGATLIGGSPEQYDRFWSASRAGIVNWNRPSFTLAPNAPLGGVGRSGNHRPGGYYTADFCAYPVASAEIEQPRATIGIGLKPLEIIADR